jgi:hypothetical protein
MTENYQNWRFINGPVDPETKEAVLKKLDTMFRNAVKAGHIKPHVFTINGCTFKITPDGDIVKYCS